MSLCGLCVSDNNPWLPASPDGLVVDNSSSQKFGLLEIKCPFMSDTIPQLMPSSSFPLVISDNSITLKKNHPYFTQVQQHMAIVDWSWCDFVAYTHTVPSNSRSIEVARVKRDNEF